MLNSIAQRAQSVTRWLGRQVTESDFGSGDQKTRDYALIGAGVGVVAGAVAGTVAGFNSQADNNIEEVWVDRNVTHPEMRGYTHSAVPDMSTRCTTDSQGDQSCVTEINGWWHRYSPSIHHRIVGQFQEPTFQNSNFLEPLTGGLLGALGGGAIGLAAGIGVAALQKSLHKSESPATLQPEVKSALSQRAGMAVLAGGAIGAGLGAYLGAHAGNIELASKEIHTRTWDIPVTRTETLGYIPSDHYEYNWSGFPISIGGHSRPETVPVNREIPVYDRDGDPTFTGTTRTFETNRYGPFLGGIAGGLMGAGIGLAAGVAFGVTDKLLTERAQNKAERRAA